MNIICYLSNGFSQEKTLENAARYIKGHCDIIEIDLPTDNPFLDNPLIQERMQTSFKQDPTLETQASTILKIREQHPSKKLLLLCYEHTVKHYGVQRFIQLAQTVCPEAVILVGAQSTALQHLLIENQVKVASYIPFHLPESEIQAARRANGFIYLQATPTGQVREGCDTLKKVIAYLRERGFTQPIYGGMGVSTPEDVQRLKKAGADGAFIGSSLLKLEGQPQEMVQFIKSLKQASI